MTLSTKTTVLSVAAVLLATGASAQSTTFTNQGAVQDGVDAIQDQVQTDFDKGRDARDFGPEGKRLGWYGSLAASGNATSGNTDTANLGIGANFGHFNGTNGHDVSLTYNYGEDDSIASSNSLAAAYEYTRYFNNDFYGFGLLSGKYDEFGSFEQDIFAGVGLGYRVVNTPSTSWSLRAGPGYRVAKLSDGSDFEEAAFTVGSKLFYEISDTAFVNMDTDVLTSESDTSIVNDLGLNVSINGPLALRTSLRTEYHTDPLPGDKSTDSILGVSLVYTFN